MKVFRDEERELSWISFEKAKEEKCKQAIAELNSWSGTPNIDRFIVEGMPLGDFMAKIYASTKNPAFMYDTGFEEPKELNDFLYFIYETENPETLAGATILSSDYRIDELFVDYLVINPKLQNRGIGTRFIRSLQENMQVLSGRRTNNVLTTTIDKENIASIKLFSKVCKPIKQTEIEGNINKFWVFTSREMEKEKG